MIRPSQTICSSKAPNPWSDPVRQSVALKPQSMIRPSQTICSSKAPIQSMIRPSQTICSSKASIQSMIRPSQTICSSEAPNPWSDSVRQSVALKPPIHDQTQSDSLISRYRNSMERTNKIAHHYTSSRLVVWPSRMVNQDLKQLHRCQRTFTDELVDGRLLGHCKGICAVTSTPTPPHPNTLLWLLWAVLYAPL